MATRKSSRSRSPKAPSRHAGIGALFWVCLTVIVVAVGFAAREPIAGALERMHGNTPAPRPPVPQVTVRPLTGTETAPPPVTSSYSNNASPAITAPAASQHPGAVTSSSAGTPTAATSDTRVRKARLFFASVDQDGAITVKSVLRSIPSSDSPLHDSLVALLKGPTSQELNLGLVSMIPSAAALRSVVVKDDTAVVDFSEGFRFNALGVDAMNAELRQVVYAATEFPTVKQVQLLIEGKKVTYLGTEGVRIDQPLSRASFQK